MNSFKKEKGVDSGLFLSLGPSGNLVLIGERFGPLDTILRLGLTK